MIVIKIMIEYWMRASSMNATSRRGVGKIRLLFLLPTSVTASPSTERRKGGEDIIARWADEGYESEESIREVAE